MPGVCYEVVIWIAHSLHHTWIQYCSCIDHTVCITQVNQHTNCMYMHCLQIHTSCAKHYLSSNRHLAALRQRGGFKTIAAKIGLSPQRLDKRGRKPKKPALQQPDASAEPAGAAPVNLVQAFGHKSACKQPPGVCVQVGELEQMSHELELV